MTENSSQPPDPTPDTPTPNSPVSESSMSDNPTSESSASNNPASTQKKQNPAAAVRDVPLDQIDFEAAMRAVKSSLAQLEAGTEEERKLLRHALEQLHTMAEKLAAGRIEIVVFGEISTGKSALINALVGQQVAQVNIRGGWTKDIWPLLWKECGYKIPGFDASEVFFLDTPGLNEVQGADRGDLARETAQRADLILFVTDSDLNETEYTALCELAASHKPILLVFNKIDLYNKEQRLELMKQFQSVRMREILSPLNIIQTASDPREIEYITEDENGNETTQWRKPAPEIAQLQERILSILKAEGKSLLAINAAMFAADKSDQMAATRILARNQTATNTIWSFAVTKSLAVALNPGALLDVIGGAAVDVTMLVALGKVYDIKITTTNAQSLITSILKAAGWVMLGEAVVSYAASFFKGITLGSSTPITMIPQGAAAGYGSYIVGQAARYYFEHGASWGDASPKQVIQQILENTDKDSVLQHLKDAIKKKISTNPHAKKK